MGTRRQSQRNLCKTLNIVVGTTMEKQFSMLDGNDVMELTAWCRKHYPQYFTDKGERLHKVDTDQGTMKPEDDTYGVMQWG